MEFYINSRLQQDHFASLQSAMDYADIICANGDAVKIITNSSVASKVFGFPGVWYVRDNDGYKNAWDQC